MGCAIRFWLRRNCAFRRPFVFSKCLKSLLHRNRVRGFATHPTLKGRGRLKKSGSAALHVDDPHFGLRAQAQGDAPEAVAGGYEEVAVADFFVAVVQAVEAADDKVGGGDLAVVDVAGDLDVHGQAAVCFDLGGSVVEQDDGGGRCRVPPKVWR